MTSNKERLIKELRKYADEVYKFGIRRFLIDEWVDHQINITETFHKKGEDWDENALSMILEHCLPEYWAVKILEENVSWTRKREGTTVVLEHPNEIKVYSQAHMSACLISKGRFEPPATLLDVQRYFGYGNCRLLNMNNNEIINDSSILLEEGETYCII